MPVSSTIVDGQILYAANLASNFAQAAAIAGDNFTGPVTIQGIDIGSGLKNAYNAANAAFNAANTGSSSSAAFNQANNALNTAQAAYAQSNSTTNLVVSSYNLVNSTTNLVNSSFSEANIALTIAQAAFNQSNSVGNVTSINYMAGQALTVNGKITTTVIGNGTLTIAANSATVAQTGVVQLNDTTLSTSKVLAATANSVNTVWSYAQSAFIVANTINTFVASAYNRANSVDGIGSLTLTGTSGIAINGGSVSTLGSNGTLAITANVGSTTVIGAVQLNDTVISTSASLAATANAVNTAMVYAQGAFAKANTSGGGISSITIQAPNAPFTINASSSGTVSGNGTLTLASNTTLTNLYYVDTYGQNIQTTINACQANGGGIVALSAHDYILGSGTIIANANLTSICGVGNQTRLLCQNITANTPVFNFFYANESTIPLRNVQLCANNAGKINANVATNGAGHNNYVANSIAIKFTSSTFATIKDVEIQNFDKGTAWDANGNIWSIDFENCLFGGCNTGFTILGPVNNSFERMTIRKSSLSGCNYGAYINIPNIAGSIFLEDCSIDFNAKRAIYFVSSTTNTQLASLLLNGNHIETTDTCSGIANARIYVEGSIQVNGNYFYENGAAPVAFIELNQTTSYSRGKAIGNHFAVATNTPIFYTSDTGQFFAGGWGNTWESPNEIILAQATEGLTAGESDVTGNYLYINGFDGQSDLEAQKRVHVLVAGSSGNGSFSNPYIWNLLNDSSLSHAIGTELKLFNLSGSYFSIVPGPGVTLNPIQCTTTLSTIGQYAMLRKTAANFWYMYTGPTSAIIQGLDDSANTLGLGAPAIIRGTIYGHLAPGVTIGALGAVTTQATLTRQATQIGLQNALYTAVNNNKNFELVPNTYEIYTSNTSGLLIPVNNGLVWRGCPNDTIIKQFYSSANGVPIVTLGDITGVNTTQHADIEGMYLAYGNTVTNLKSANALMIGALAWSRIGKISSGIPNPVVQLNPAWDNVNIPPGIGAGQTFFSNILDGFDLYGAQNNLFTYRNSGTGSIFDNIYLTGGGGSSNFPAVACALYANHANIQQENDFRQLNIEWLSCNNPIFLQNAYGTKFSHLHMEGIKLTGFAPTLILTSLTSLTIDQWTCLDIYARNGDISGGTTSYIRSYNPGNDNLKINQMIMQTNFTNEINVAAVVVDTTTYPPSGGGLSNIVLENFRSSDVGGGNFTNVSIDANMTQTANAFYLPTTFQKYTWSIFGSKVEYPLITVSPTLGINYDHWGALQQATLITNASATSPFTINLRNTILPTSNIPLPFQSMVHINRLTGTFANNIIIKTSDGLNLATSSASNQDYYYLYNGARYNNISSQIQTLTIPVNSIVSNTNYILTWNDSGQTIIFSNSGATIVNINNTVSTGFRTVITQTGTGSVQLVPGANVIINPRTGTNNQITTIYGSMSVFAYASNANGLYIITDGSIA